jgi:uncharacterized protein
MKNYRLRWLGAALLGGFILTGCAVLDQQQGRWIFNPTDRTWGNTAEVASGMREAWIKFDSKITGKATQLHALIAEHQSDEAAVKNLQRPILMYLHGARWNVVGSAWRIERMRELGFTVIAVDYRGFGKSTQETPSEAKSYEDARAAWHWIKQTFPERDVYIFGHSLGGAIAIELATQVPDEKGVIVEGTFTSIPDVVRASKYGWAPVGALITQRFDSASKVAKIGSPLLVVHGSNDQLISPTLGQRLYEAARIPKRFELVQGGSHHNTNGIGQSQYRAALKELFGLNTDRP